MSWATETIATNGERFRVSHTRLNNRRRSLPLIHYGEKDHSRPVNCSLNFRFDRGNQVTSPKKMLQVTIVWIFSIFHGYRKFNWFCWLIGYWDLRAHQPSRSYSAYQYSVVYLCLYREKIVCRLRNARTLLTNMLPTCTKYIWSIIYDKELHHATLVPSVKEN